MGLPQGWDDGYIFRFLHSRNSCLTKPARSSTALIRVCRFCLRRSCRSVSPLLQAISSWFTPSTQKHVRATVERMGKAKSAKTWHVEDAPLHLRAPTLCVRQGSRGQGMNEVEKSGRVPLWFDRKFDFSFPVELLPNICTRLRGTPARLEEVLRGRPKKVLIWKSEGKWSAQEHAGHLLDLEPLWAMRVGDYLEGQPQLTVADLTNQRITNAKHNEKSLKLILTKFRAGREKLLKRVDEKSWNTSLFIRQAIHPRLQTPMRLVDHLYFVAEQQLYSATVLSIIKRRAS